MSPIYCNIQNEFEPTRHTRMRRIASLSLVGMISALFSGCANDWALSEAAQPIVKPIYIARGSETADSYYTLGKYYFWQNRYAQARDAFEHALKLQPGNVDVLNGLGSVYDQLGQFEAAQRSYRLALDKAPEAAYIWANLGYSLLLQGRAVTAAALLEKAVALDPANAIAQRHLALATQEAAKLAASTPEPGQELPVVASTFHAPEVAATSDTLPKSSASSPTRVAKAQAAGPAVVTLMPHRSVQHSEFIQAVVPVHNTSPAPALPKQQAMAASVNVPQGERITPVRASAVRFDPPSTRESATYGPAVSAPSIDMKTPAFNHARIEISNGNGVNGMARALRTVVKAEGVNVTRVTNALPFNKQRTIIICSNELKDTAKAIGRLLPGNPSIAIGSTASRNVEIRVVLGADAALAWNNTKKFNVAALYP